MNLTDLSIKLFADTADLPSMLRLTVMPYIRGFTTNPTLMRQAGIRDYRQFATWAVTNIPDKPISFEVLADDPDTMERQARLIAAWGPNVYVKIPVVNTQGAFMTGLIRRLSRAGIRVNVTALFTHQQVAVVLPALENGAPAILSVFAGRIADTGRDPLIELRSIARQCQAYPSVELLWASTREVYNIIQADQVGCDIITVTPDLLAKLTRWGSSLDEGMLATVQQFATDAQQAGYTLD